MVQLIISGLGVVSKCLFDTEGPQVYHRVYVGGRGVQRQSNPISVEVEVRFCCIFEPFEGGGQKSLSRTETPNQILRERRLGCEFIVLFQYILSV